MISGAMYVEDIIGDIIKGTIQVLKPVTYLIRRSNKTVIWLKVKGLDTISLVHTKDIVTEDNVYIAPVIVFVNDDRKHMVYDLDYILTYASDDNKPALIEQMTKMKSLYDSQMLDIAANPSKHFRKMSKSKVVDKISDMLISIDIIDIDTDLLVSISKIDKKKLTALAAFFGRNPSSSRMINHDTVEEAKNIANTKKILKA